MRVNYNNQDLKSINWRTGYSCISCVFNSTHHLCYCELCCRSGKIWIKDVANSHIFNL